MRCKPTNACLALLMFALSGCTLVGTGAGAAIDAAVPGPYREDPGAHVARLHKGDAVVVRLRSGTRIDGRYVTAYGPTPRDVETYLIIDTGARVSIAAASDVHSIAVEVPGKGWLYGMIAGGAVDLAVIVAFAILYEGPSYNGNLQLGGDSGCFC